MSRKLTGSLIVVTILVACSDHPTQEEEEASILSTQEQAASVHADLGDLRHVTMPYRDISVATDNGFQFGINGILKNCVEHPTLGAMGYHYSRQDRFDDPAINELEPEVLVYQTAGDGSLKLGAVEWVVPKAAWEAVHGVGAPPPEVYGVPLTVINPVLNWYVAHAWIWKGNPSGVMSDWNPKVSCP